MLFHIFDVMWYAYAKIERRRSLRIALATKRQEFAKESTFDG